MIYLRTAIAETLSAAAHPISPDLSSSRARPELEPSSDVHMAGSEEIPAHDEAETARVEGARVEAVKDEEEY